MRTRSIKILGMNMGSLRRSWREETGGPVLRSLLGKVRAHVRYTGSIWRGTVFTDAGTSSATSDTVTEAMDWCKGELRR